jgi:hypothetical protein
MFAFCSYGAAAYLSTKAVDGFQARWQGIGGNDEGQRGHAERVWGLAKSPFCHCYPRCSSLFRRCYFAVLARCSKAKKPSSSMVYEKFRQNKQLMLSGGDRRRGRSSGTMSAFSPRYEARQAWRFMRNVVVAVVNHA